VLNSDVYAMLPKAAHLFYGGAMFYLLSTCVCFYSATSLIMTLSKSSPEPDQGDRMATAAIIIAPFLLNWIASWLFWAGFLGVAGDL
jgi:hypothetical protein